MRAAIIGGGFSGAIHADALRACGIELAAVVTSRGESAKRYADRWNVPLYGTDSSIAYGETVDAVHICTPPATHAGYVREAILAGKHVLCEKPLSLDAGEAQELAALADSSKVRCGVCFNVRYHMAVQKARELICSGTFGRPLLIHGSYLQEFHILPAPYDWRYDQAASGGLRAVTEIGSHWIDTAQYVSGQRIRAVSATFGNFFPDRIVKDGMMEAAPAAAAGGQPLHVDSEDAACLTFRTEDGALGNVFLSEISPGRGNRLSLEITCEHGNLWWNAEENNVLYTAKKGEGIRAEVFAFGNGFGDTFSSLFRSFYEGGQVPGFEEAAGVARVCEAAARSAAEHSAWVEL